MAEGGIIIMRQKALTRLHIVRQVLDKKLKQIEAADKLNLSYRQTKRITKRVKKEGDCGIIHRSRGKPSNRKLPQSLKEKVINLYRKKYYDFGPTFANEKLFEINKITIGVQTLRNWLMEAGLWQIIRKFKKHRKWRQPKHCFGEMVQWDGSHHPWFEDRGHECVLIGQIDDATNKKSGQFYGFEGTIPAFASLKQYIKAHGIPQSIYLDKHTTYKSPKKPTVEDELNNREFLSQFERAAKELGITIIHANSAPAKGRIERSFKTDQDRLVKELRLAGISTIEEANKFLKAYWPKHNKRFGVQPLKEANLHRPVPQGLDLDAILCRKTEHPLRNDFTIVHDKKLYQILDKQAGRKVTVEEKINGALYITYNGMRLKYKQITQRPLKEKPEPKLRKIIRPSLEHPWKKVSYDRWLAKKALLQTEKASKELVLTEA
jgi:hypothetical protein